MSKRIIRILPDNFQEKLLLLIQKEIQVILLNRSVFKVKLLFCYQDNILVENKVKFKQSFLISQIKEIQIDEKSIW